MNGRRLVLGFALANLAWTLSLIAAPLSLPAGTVSGLHGHANVVDHWDRWSELPVFARLVYAAGDLNCHQIAARSWMLGGNQIPVDVRMFAGFLMGSFGFAIALLRPASWRYRESAVQILPASLRVRLDTPARRLGASAALWFIALTPALVDVVAQLALAYESTNLNRLLTGSLLGVLGGFLIGALLRSLMEPRPVSAAPAPQQADG